MSPELALQLVGVGATSALGFLAWSLKRNISAQDLVLTEIANDLRRLSASVGNHSERLAAGDVEIRTIAARVQGIEDRERQRVCTAQCHHA